jgi:phage-related protein
MSEEQKTTSDAPAEEQAAGGQIMDELQALGQELTAAFKSLWESPESRNLRQEIGEGFVELGNQLDSALKSAQESEAAKQFGEQVKETVDKARASDIAGKLEQGLVDGLRSLNEQVARLVSSVETHHSAQEEPPEAEE